MRNKEKISCGCFVLFKRGLYSYIVKGLRNLHLVLNSEGSSQMIAKYSKAAEKSNYLFDKCFSGKIFHF